MDNLSSPDLLSDLPLDIIHYILSFVPIIDTMETSLLSRKWRYIWRSLPYLAFDDKCVNSLMETESNIDRPIRFINQTLLLHEGPIHKFQLCMPPMCDPQCFNQWLPLLSRNGVRNLVLQFDDNESGFELHSSLYSCQNLTDLKLHLYSIYPPPPSFKGFLFLRSLDIYLGEDNPCRIESIVTYSPLLEELKLNCMYISKTTIHALKLKYLQFCSMYDLSLCTPLLQELKGCFEDIRFFSIGVESLVFHHLRTIQLSDVPFDYKEVTLDVIRLITASPNLHKLEISACDSFSNYPPKLAYSWDTESAPDFTYHSLKVIKIEHSRGVVAEMKLIKLLLARSPVLEKMIYKPFQSISDDKLLKLMTKLLGYRRASANAQILISKKRSRS